MKKVYAIVLAAGNGRRMGGGIAKQYQPLCGRPVICYTLSAFEQSAVDEVVLVVAENMTEYARTEIVERYGFHKVKNVVAGGVKRCDSVYAGMSSIRAAKDAVVLVHDGARPFATPKLIGGMIEAAKKHGCAVPAVRVKDTIKQVRCGFVAGTPKRSELYAVQTPQAFHYSVLWEAFEKYHCLHAQESGQLPEITDDAMLVECMLGKKIAAVEGDYRNIKLTTPEDMILARAFLTEHGENENSGTLQCKNK